MGERAVGHFAKAVKATAEPAELPGDPDAGAVLLTRRGDSEGCVVIAHGGGNDRFFGLRYIIQRLLDARFEVVTAHLAGHGCNGADVFTLAHANTRLDALVACARQRSRTCAVLGQSLGGTLALDQVARGQGGDAVVSVSAPCDLRTGFRLGLEMGCLVNPAVYRQIMYVGPFGALPAYRGFRRSTFPVRTPNSLDYLEAFASAVEATALTERLRTATIPSPVLIVHGERDGVVPCTQAGELAEAVGANARQNLEPGVHHLDPLLTPRVVTRIVHWLQKLTEVRPTAPNPTPDGE